MSTIENIRDRFKNSINYSIRHDEDLDASGWNNQDGILLSCNEAKLLLENEESLIKQNEEMKEMLEKIVLVTDNFNGSFQDFKERYNSEIEKFLNKTTQLNYR